MKKIGIIAKNIPRAHGAVRKLSKWLAARGKKVLLDERTASDSTCSHIPRRGRS